MKHNILRLAVAFSIATGLLGFLETVAYAGDGAERLSPNHSEPQR